MRRRWVVLAAVALALACISAGEGYAITNGQSDSNRHPYVGLLLFWEPGQTYPSWFCSGSLISETVVLTAGHCTFGAERAQVWFNQNPIGPDFPLSGGVWSAPNGVRTHPNFSWNWQKGLLGWDTVDTGVVILNEPVVMDQYAALPAVGIVDTLPMKTGVDLVGYGSQFKLKQSGSPYDRWATNFQRYYAPSQVVTSDNRNSDLWLKLTANPGQNKGGICFGDSGGPDLLGESNIILATNSFVPNQNCAGVDYSNRIDRAIVLDWVGEFLK